MSVRRIQQWALPASRLAGNTLLRTQLEDAPLAAWPLDEASGSVAYDATGNTRNGTYTAVTLAQPQIAPGGAETAALWNGTTSRCTIPSATWMNSSSYTFEILVNATSFAGNKSFGHRDIGGSAPRLWQFFCTDGIQVGTSWSSTGAAHTPGGSPACTATQPYLVALRWQAGVSVTTWRNGVQWGSIATTGNAQVGVRDLILGGLGTYNTFTFAGRMSNAAYYGTALSDARLLAHAQAAGLA